jgi:hypothetical protein
MTIAMIPSQLWAEWEPYNKNHGPFEPNSWPLRFSLHRCDSLEVSAPPTEDFVVKSCHGIRDRPRAPTIYVGSKPNQRGTWLLVKDCNGVTLAGLQQAGDFPPAWLEVYWADLNADGKEDFVGKAFLGGNGTILTFLCDVVFLLSNGGGYVVTTTEGLWSGFSYFVDLDGNGVCEFIHTAFVEGGHVKGRDGRGHSYWVYNVLSIRDGRLFVNNRLAPQFPKWIWYTHRPNHSATTQITPSQQRLLWREQPDRIFWRPKTESEKE